ncbi:MAG: PilZ domain-containing protein [Bacteroidetes bacterium]|nr:PilZ domain-containing protein [Bacteroidota bacterium]MCL5027291.1 PilZ domain-containing protein [Chloroflexota bacterium]
MIENGVNIDSILKIGQLVKIGVSTTYEMVGSASAENDGIRLYSSRIDNILPEELVVAWPTDKGVQVPFDIDQSVSLYLFQDRGMYQLDSRIVHKIGHPLPALHIARSGLWGHVQLRHNVRLDITLVPSEAQLIQSQKGFPHDIRPYIGAIQYAITLDERRRSAGKRNGSAGHVSNWDALQADQIQIEPINMLIRNLSAGGMLVTSERKVDMDSILRTVFPLGKGQRDIEAISRVVWVGEDETSKKLRYRAGCQFLNLGTRQQDNITRFIFARQAELRRSGLL